MVNSLTGTRMFVAPEREAEYLAAGHTRVADAPAAQTVAEPPKAQAPAAKTAPKPSRPAAKKPTTKRSTAPKK